MKRITFARLVVLMLAVAGLALQGCGGDDNGGLSAADMARIDAAEADAAAAKADAAAAKAEADAAKAAAEAEDPDADTSDLDAQIAALQKAIDALTKKTADPATPLAILGGTKSTASANDRAALATKIAGQLNATYDHDGDEGMVELAELPGDAPVATEPVQDDVMTRDRSHASNPADPDNDDMTKIMSGDGTSMDGGFLKHSFTGGPTVDLTSPGDIETLSLKNLLEVDGVDLKSFSLKETDKVMVEPGPVAAVDADPAAGVAAVALLAAGDTRTTTLGADGSMMVVTTDGGTKAVSARVITTFAGGNKIVETPTAEGDSAANAQAMITLADGRRATWRADMDTGGTSPDTDYTRDPAVATAYNAPDADAMSPAAELANAKATYANAGAAYTTAQHNAMGYGAWLVDSFFVAYVINAEDDLILNDPDSMAMKIAWGGRANDSAMASDLSGRGETAMWKGLMVGHDMDAEAATANEMLKGNASITARVGEATLADQSVASAPDIVDVSLTNIITADGTAVSRVADGIHWTNLDLDGGGFKKGTEIVGAFYDNGNEVVGEFNKSKILGVFGAVEYEMMDTMDDM